MIGQTISHYKITEKLGEGGMGVVYKAEDTKLKRSVALKFLRSDVLEDEEHKERFLREAQAAAALDHPNICTVYEIDEADGKTFLSMAFLEGRTVKAKLKERPLKLEETLDIAIQTATGLQAAHEKGIVHRDIKGANLMVTPQGQVKIMDFGLAQLAERSQLTKTATILGTPAYMSPEQAQRLPTDRRTDMWSLGVVIYEMVTGRLPFEGERQVAVLYAIGNEEPEPITALRVGVPTELDFIVSKAMAKDAGERYQHIEDLIVDLRRLRKEVSGETRSGTGPASERFPVQRSSGAHFGRSVEPANRRGMRAYQALFALAATIALALAIAPFRQPPPDAPVRRFAFTSPVPVPADHEAVAVSPNGKRIAFTTETGGTVWVRDLGQQEARPLAGTEGARSVLWSPGSDFIAYVTAGDLKKAPVQGGRSTQICELPSCTNFNGGTWSPDGETIVFACGQGGVLYEVPAIGGSAVVLNTPTEAAQSNEPAVEAWSGPHFLPAQAGNRVLAVGVWRGVVSPEIAILDLETGRQSTVGPGVYPVYSPTGHLLYQPAQGSSEVWAVPFSLDTLQAEGKPFPVAQNVRSASVSSDGGLLVYLDVSASARQQLVWLNREGEKTGEIGEPQRSLWAPAISPDGGRVSVSWREGGSNDVFIWDLDRAVRTRLTTDPASARTTVWSPDGENVAFISNREGNVDFLVRRADGSGEATPLASTPLNEFVTDWSRDGRYIAYTKNDPDTGDDLWCLERTEDGNGWEPRLFYQTEAAETQIQFSPDGRFVAYASAETGRWEIYVQPFPEGGPKWTVSTGQGKQPRWSRDGREVFYLEEGKTMVAVPVSTEPSFSAGKARRLFDLVQPLNANVPQYDVSADRERFLVVTEGEGTAESNIHVVENWYEDFRDQE